MIRRATAAALAILIGLAAIGVGPVDAAPPGSITWSVDHAKKTITVTIKLQIYSGCSGDPLGKASTRSAACKQTSVKATQDLAGAIKARSTAVWNKGYHYRCYRLVVVVDVTLAPDRSHVDPDRLGVRMDPSPLGIRSWVDAGHSYDKSKWQSNDPADLVDPQNGTQLETTWSVQAKDNKTHETYAHEVGHMLGLHDGYEDIVDPATHESVSTPYPDAPRDLMSTGEGTIAQETIDRLVERNRNNLLDGDKNKVDLAELVCDPEFMAFLHADQEEYHASHLVNSIASPPCSRAPFTASTRQTLKVVSTGTGVRVVEDRTLPAGYVFLPTFDPLTVQGGLSGGGRGAGATGLFDLFVTIDVGRFNSRPASGITPPVLDFQDKTCTGGDTGATPRPSDCGTRSFTAWMAIAQRGGDLWTARSSLPYLLKDLGYSQPRFDRLYTNCAGPAPWPGAFVEEERFGISMSLPNVPPISTLNQVASDWKANQKPGRIDLSGDAEFKETNPGSLEADVYEWILTLCPLNAAGEMPPGCP